MKTERIYGTFEKQTPGQMDHMSRQQTLPLPIDNNNDALLFSGLQVGGLPISKHGDCPMIHKMNLRKDPKLQRLEMGSGM